MYSLHRNMYHKFNFTSHFTYIMFFAMIHWKASGINSCSLVFWERNILLEVAKIMLIDVRALVEFLDCSSITKLKELNQRKYT